MGKHDYSDWDNFKAMFSGLGEDLMITAALLAVALPPIFLMLWAADAIFTHFK